MEPKIVGTVMPVLELSMQPNEKVFAESGQLHQEATWSQRSSEPSCPSSS